MFESSLTPFTSNITFSPGFIGLTDRLKLELIPDINTASSEVIDSVLH